MPTIKTVDVTKYYVDKKSKTAVAALYKANCLIPNNSFTVIVGESGCGKTTLVRTLAGLTSPDEGTILFDNADVTSSSAQSRNASYLTQEYALYPHMTVFDNIAYPLKIMRASADEIRKRVGEVCELLDITLLISRRISQLSGGQLQRVALGRALVKNPDIVFLDEPLSNLDEKTRYTLSMQFKELQKKLNCTFIYVTHSVAEAQRLASYIIVMNNGEVIQQGEATEIINDKNGAFHEFVNATGNVADIQAELSENEQNDEII